MAPGYGFSGGRTRGRRRQQDASALLTLLLPLAHHIARLPNKPPVTLGLVALMVALYLQPQGFEFAPSTAAACLQPRRVLEGREWGRLLWSGLLHADDLHIYYNMASLLWKGVVLEPAIGSAQFARLVVELLLVSQVLYTLIAAGLAEVYPALFLSGYHGTCAVGFSGVLFALKVVLNARSADMENIYGVRVPAKYVAWVELVIISLITPNASFLGHLAGILAGLLHLTLFDRGTGATPGDGFSARVARRLRRLLSFRRPYSGAPRYAQRGAGAASTRQSSRRDAGSGGPAAAAPGGTALGDPPPEDEDPAAVRERVRQQRERYFAQQGMSSSARRGDGGSSRGSGGLAADLGPALDPVLGALGVGVGSAVGSTAKAADSGGGIAAAAAAAGAAWRSATGGRRRRRRQQSGWLAAVAAMVAFAAAAWAAKPTPASFAEYIARVAHRGFGRWPGLAVHQLLRLQTASGFGLRFHDLGVALLARHQGLWFGGAFGRWVPLPSPWMVRPSASSTLALAFVACWFLRRYFLSPAAVMRHLEVGPGCWPTAFLFAGLCHDSAVRTAASSAFMLAAGRQLEAAVGGGGRLLAAYFAGGAAVHAALWAFHTYSGPRLWRARLGCGVPLAALLAFAAASAPGATILRLQALPPLGQAAGGIANAAGGQFAAVQAAWPAVGGGRVASVLQRYYSPAASRRGHGGKQHGGSAAAGWPGAAGSAGPQTRQVHRSGRRGASRAVAAGSITGSSSSTSGGGGAGLWHAGSGGSGGRGGRAIAEAAGNRGSRSAVGGPGALAVLPLQLGAWQLLVAMAVPAIASLVPAFVAWAVAAPGVFCATTDRPAPGLWTRLKRLRRGRRQSSGSEAARRAADAVESLATHTAAIAAGLALYQLRDVLPV